MQKFLQELEATKDTQIKTIGSYLKKRAEEDELFKPKLDNEEKSLNQCFGFIKGEAKKQAQNGCAMIEDDVVYGWAVHYYDENNESLGINNRQMDVSKNQNPRFKSKEKEVVLPKIEEKPVKKAKTKLSDLQESLF